MSSFPSAKDLEAGASRLGDRRPLLEQCFVTDLFDCFASKLMRAHHKLAPGVPAQDSYEFELPMNYFGFELINRVLKRIRDETEWTLSRYDRVTRTVMIARPAVAASKRPSEPQVA